MTAVEIEKKFIEIVEVTNTEIEIQVQEKIVEIEKIVHTTCDETMNWMLEEAIENNENFNTIIAN